MTHIDHDLNKVHIFLLYRGNNRFDEMRRIGGMEYRSMYKELTKSSWKIDWYFQQKKEKKELLECSESSSDDESSSHPSNDDIEIDMERMMEEDDGYASAHEQDIVESNVQKQAPLYEDQGSVSNVQKSPSQALKEENVSDSVDRNKNDEKKDVLKGGQDVKADISSMRKEDTVKLETDEGASKEGDTSGNVQKNVTITAGKLINKARSRVKGSWHFVKSKRHIDEKARTCKICGQVKDTLQKLEKHMRKKHKKFKYKCRFCSKLYLSKNGLYKHKLYHRIGLHFTCKKCDRTFMFYLQYREHCNVHTDTNRLPC